MLICINCSNLTLECALVGHGNSVNDVRLHTQYDCIVFSASKDESVRMWNLTTNTCISKFASEGGHRDDVLSIDMHPLGHSLVSSGMDPS